jgi:Ca2+-binding RTX toxin-like protein
MFLEHLESRRFLSVTIHPSGTDLIINGTGKPDHIAVVLTRSPIDDSDFATVSSNHKAIWSLAASNGALIPFPQRFILLGRGGADHLIVYGKQKVDARVIVRGGPGNDRIFLSSDDGFPARVWGNQGDDMISILGSRFSPTAWRPSQWGHLVNVHGNAGDDVIDYVTHYDHRNGVNAMNGYARLFGDSGNDIIIGGQTFDRLQGGGGDDTLYGEGGGDLLIGGAGDDHIMGGPGDNVIHQGSPPWSLRM